MTRPVDRTTRDLQARPTRRAVLKGAAAAGIATLAGPLGSGAAPATQATPAAHPVSGGTLHFGAAAEPKVLDPHITTLDAYVTTIRYTVFETLIEADDQGNYTPNLADKWAFSADGMALTLNLAQGVKFHNGKDFTAQDVIFTVNRIKDPKLSSQFAPQVSTVASVQAVDDHTVTFHFTAPTPSMLDNLLYIQIVTQTGIDQIGKHPIGTGPFEFVEWKLNDHMTLKKYANYRRAGLPYLDELIFRFITDSDARLTNLQAGSVDIIEQLALKDASRVKSAPKLQLIATPPTSGYVNFQINMQNPLVTDARVRQALSFAFDRETYVRDVLYGFGVPAVGPFSKINWAYDPLVEPYLKFDLDKSKQLLAAAGHASGKGLQGLEILSPLGYPQLKQAAVLLQANLSTIGVNASVRELEIAAWEDRIATKPDYVMTTDSYSYGGASDPAAVFNTDNLNPATNVPQFRDPTYKALVLKGATTPDKAERKKIYSQLQQILMDQMPEFLIAHQAQVLGALKTVHGFNPGALVRYKYTQTWIAH